MEPIVILLMGPQGSGKTQWCREHLPDFVRISQDDHGPREHVRLFEEAVQRGLPRIVVDRTNAPKYQRKRYLEPARRFGYRTRIVWLNVDRHECLRRCRERTDHPTLPPDKAEEALGNFFRNLQPPTRLEADEIIVVGPPPDYLPVRDVTAEIGSRRHLIVGDIHGCLDELRELLDRVGFNPHEDVLISVGDIVDRGPRIRETIEFLFGLPRFHMVLGNHDDKLLRYLRGHPVKVNGGLEDTVAAFGGQFPPDLLSRLESLPLILRTPSGYVVHAGFNPDASPDEQFRDDCLYIRYHGGRTYFDRMNGVLWYALWPRTAPRVFFGHIPTDDGPCEPHVVGLDGGCVFGGELRLFDSRDGQIHRQPAARVYRESEYAHPAGIVGGPEHVRKREEYVAQGLIRSDRTDDGQLAIYTYSDACTFANAWDDVTRNSRGHIFHVETGECVAWAFPKFFNLGENLTSLPETFPWHEPFEILEKLDGWLGVLYRHEGQFKVATRGSFHSSGSVWATDAIQSLDFSCLPDAATLCFEIITPEQRIILNYGDERRLVVLAAFNRFTGDEFPRELVEEWCRQIGLSIVPRHPPMSLEELLREQKSRQHVEGFVLRFGDGKRVKIKTEWYLELARIMANLSPIAVWEAMRGGRVPPEFRVRIPEELRPLAEQYAARLESQHAELRSRLEADAQPLLAQFAGDRANLGRYVQQNSSRLGLLRKVIFQLADGKHDKVDETIREAIYPRGNQFVEL